MSIRTQRINNSTVSQASTALKKLMMTSALTAAGFIGLAGTAHADYSWGGLTQTEGSFATDTTDANNTHITLGSDRAVGTGNADIYASDSVYVSGGSIFAVVDNRIDPTQILGKLSYDGKIIIIDGNGVFFGANSQVDVGGMIATTGNIDPQEIMSNPFGQYTLNDVREGSIDIAAGAQITASEGGLLAFVAPTVSNSGIIKAKLGKIAFASGEKVTLDLYGDELVEIEVSGESEAALVENTNTGKVIAEGGEVYMTAAAAKKVVDNIINVDGIVDVSSATMQGGKIVLSGGDSGTVQISGKIDASGTTGGEIKVTAQDINAAETSQFVADGGTGSDQNGDGGQIDIVAINHTDYRGRLSARGGALGGNGGDAEVSGLKYLGYEGSADLSAADGEMGTLLMDPAFAVIHSGAMNNPLGLGYVLSAQALANSMETSNVVVQADNYIDVGTKTDAYNTGDVAVDAILNSLVGTDDINLSTYNYNTWGQTGSFKIGPITIPVYGWINHNGTTAGSLILQSDIVNFNKDVTIGDGSLGVDANTVNLDSRIYDKDGVTELADERLFSNAGTVNVISNAASIQQGIYLSNDTGGATVNVAKDTYTENLIIDRSLNLIGANATLQSAGGASLITVTAADVTIDPFNFIGDGSTTLYGIYADGADNLIVDGNSFSGFVNANVSVKNSAKVKIFDNTMIGGQSGIEADNAFDLKVFDNDISGTTVNGIYVANSNGTNYTNDIDIWGNTVVSAAGTGIRVENSNFATIGADALNPFASGFSGGNKVSGGTSGIVVSDSDNAQVIYSTVHDVNGNAISTSDSDSVLIENNDIDDVKAGIYAYKLTNSTISSNDINGTTNGNGIMVKLGNAIDVEGNTVGDISRKGIYVDSVTDVTVANNTVNGTDEQGIFAQNLKGTTKLIQDNTVDNTGGDAIAALDSDNIQVLSNDIGTVAGNVNGNGVSITGSSNATVNSNTIADAAADGILLVNAANALVGWNTISGVDGSGISLSGVSDLSEIKRNTINNTGENGIEIAAAYKVKVNTNKIGLAGGAGNIAGNGINASGTDTSIIEHNEVSNVAKSGIYAANTSNASIRDNAIKNVSKVGVNVQYGSNATISGNTIANIGNQGILTNQVQGLSITGNDLNNISWSGVQIEGGKNADVSGNTLYNVRGNGIQISGTQVSTNVAGNTIDTIRLDGVYINGAKNVVVYDNGVTATGGDGIDVRNTSGAIVTYNDISDAGANGVTVLNAASTLVGWNTISDVSANGISLSGTSDTSEIKRNVINNTDENGIKVADASTVKVNTNKIGLTGGAGNIGDNGIYVDHANNAIIQSNLIANTIDHGIEADLGMTQKVTIKSNTLSAIGWDGINVDGGTGVVINNNTITDVDYDGIELSNSANGKIYSNTVQSVGGEGIQLGNAGGTAVYLNKIDGTGSDAILVENSNGANIYQNRINVTVALATTAGDGISINHSNDVVVGDNEVQHALEHGVYVAYSDRAQVNSNEISRVDWDGIRFQESDNGTINSNVISNVGDDGVHAFMSDDVVINGNVITTTGLIDADGNGIIVVGNFENDNAQISGNTIKNTGSDGIEVIDHDDAVITANTIDKTGANGIKVSGSDNVTIGAFGAGNTIIRAGANGILVSGGEDASIQYNTIKGTNASVSGLSLKAGVAGAQLDGIHVENNEGVVIVGNKIVSGQGLVISLPWYLGGGSIGASGGNGANGNGIFVSGSDFAAIDQNTLSGDVFGNGLGAAQDGIRVENSDWVVVGGLTPLVNGNKVLSVGNDGINISGSNGVAVLNNIVGASDLGGDGIDMDTVNASIVIGNVITGVGENGIEFSNGTGSVIALNVINFSGDNGIQLDNAALIAIAGNEIGYSDENGIETGATTGLLIAGNTIFNSGADGVHATNGLFTVINGNTVSGSDDDGIDIRNTIFASVDGNTVEGSDDNGIQAMNVFGATISGNTVTDSGYNGVDVTGSAFVDIDGNTVIDAGNNGINAEYGWDVDVTNNIVDDVDQDGIYVAYVRDTDVTGNTVSNTGDDGIDVSYTNSAYIADNSVDNTNDDGINTYYADDVEVAGNTVTNAGGEGIESTHYLNAVVTDNIVEDSAGTGIYLDGYKDDGRGYTALVSDNTIDNSGENGLYVSYTDAFTIDNNVITNSVSDGINVYFYEGGDAIISNNQVDQSGDDGINLSGESTTIALTDNIFSNSAINGIYVAGSEHGEVVLSGNQLIDNAVGARFESGEIDLTDLVNPNVITNTDPFALPVGLQFDGAPDVLTIKDQTIGATTFDGFLNAGSFYVRFEDGSILDPITGAPLVISGLDATFDGFNPDNSGIISQGDLDFLEARIYDADDSVLNGRGQLFVGTVPDDETLENIEDFFNTYSQFGAGSGQASVTITSLPRVEGFEAGNAPQSPFSLANIAPAAGDESPETSGQNLANLEPAAGGEQDQTSCWGDAVNAASSGRVASFTFGGSFENSMAEATSCASSSAQ